MIGEFESNEDTMQSDTYPGNAQAAHAGNRFRFSELTPPARVSDVCATVDCQCHKSKAQGHVFLRTHLVYLLAIYSPEQAANREEDGETMKIREYRELHQWRGYFLHRKADDRASRARSKKHEYDYEHWRAINSVTLAAGPWLLHAPVSVLGTIPSVHEDYLTKQGVCLAPAKDATSTHIVLEIDRSRMKFYREHPNGRKTEKTVAEVMELREREVSQLKS